MMRQKTIIRRLGELSDGWDDRLQLFADNGSLVLVDYATGEIIAYFDGIDCDGGDPDHEHIDKKVYIRNSDEKVFAL